MTSVLQYYEKNTNPLCCLWAILLLILGQNGYSQSAGFRYEKRNNCAPAPVIFFNESEQGAAITYEWDFGNGTISYSREMILEAVYPDPGNYHVVLKVIEGTDTARAEADVNVARGPVAVITADQTEGCAPFDIGFLSASIAGDAPINTSFWDFRDGTSVVAVNPQHRYETEGTFDVFLEVTDNNGCADYIDERGLIQVHPEPQISFSASDTHACAPPLAVNFSNHSTADVDLNYHWVLGNGSVSDAYNATARYLTPGTYDVTLRADNDIGCSASLTKESYIVIGNVTGSIYARQGNDIKEDENDVLCPGIAYFASTQTRPADYTWHVRYNALEFTRIGQSFTYELTDSGRLDLKLVYGLNTECPDSISISFRVDHISAGFDMDRSYSCQLPASVILQDQSENAAARKWILPDNTEETAVQLPFTITHELSFEEIYSHTVNQLRFPFMQVVTSAYGCRDTAVKDFRASLPVARFMPDLVSGCIPLEVMLSDVSQSIEPIEEWTWIIDQVPASRPSGSPFVYTFDKPGEFEVLLAIENILGCTDTSYAVTIKTGEKLKPDFAVIPDEVCFGDSIRLVDNTALRDSIDFRHYSSPGLFNVTTFSNAAPTIEILSPETGYKPVHLEAGYNGCISDTVIRLAFLLKSPAGSFHETFSCDSPLHYTFIPDITMATSLEWTLHDTVIQSTDSVRYQFPSPGDYIVTLRAFNNMAACFATTQKIIKVRELRADFLSDPVVCFGDTALFFSGLSKDYITECYNEGFLWNFNDNTPRRRTFRENYDHVFADTGIFITELVARADNGCQDTLREEILVVRPQAAFTANMTEGCTSGLTVQFTKTSDDKFPVTWRWVFGDNTFDITSVSLVNHTYASEVSRTFWAGLVVQDIYSCTDEVYIPITLSEPDVTFAADDNFICVGNQVTFDAPYGSYDSFVWDFGDGTTSAVSHSHIYSVTGVYDVSLRATKNGCQQTQQKIQYISVENANAAYSVSDSVFDCYPAQVLFSHPAGSGVAEGIWFFGQGTQSSGFLENYQYTYSRPGIYNTSLWIRTPNNCEASASKTITVTGPYATFDFEPESICYGDTVTFTLTASQNVDSMTWIFGDGETSAIPVHAYKAKGIIHPALLVKQNECAVTLTYKTLSVSDVTAAFDFPDSKTSFCLNDPLQPVNQSVAYQRTTWYVNGIMVSQESELAPLLPSLPGTMQIRLTTEDSKGCTDSLTKTIIINPLPEYSIQGDTLVCSGVPSSLSIDPSGAGWSILWNPPEVLNDPSSLNPVLTIDSAAYLTALVTDENGCRSVRDMTVKVIPLPAISRLPLQDTAIFIGEQIELFVLSDNPASTYSWSPDFHISCSSCNQPVVAPENDVIYTVTVTDECYAHTELFPVEVIIDFYIETPEAFTPNGDNNNDVFIPETKNIREIREFKIFNRWGNLVFETTRLDEGWDGTVNGKIQNMDTYAYYIRAVSEHGYETEKRGNFMLLK